MICKEVVVACARYYPSIFLERLWNITKNLIRAAMYWPRFEQRTSRIGVYSVTVSLHSSSVSQRMRSDLRD
jgi:hypothetical protein